MIRNADYVMSHIIDPTGRAKKAQVGVDLTLNKVSLIGSELTIMNDSSTRYEKCAIVYNDETSSSQAAKSRFAQYREIEPTEMMNKDGVSFTAWKLEPGAYSIEFEQGLKALTAKETAEIFNRSSIGRNGVLIRSSIYDPGFETPKMGAIMIVVTPIIIEKYTRVAQILISDSEETSLYDGQYQGKKDKR